MKNKLDASSCNTGTIRMVVDYTPRWLWAALICLPALRPEAARALGVRIPNQDPEAIARGNAYAATADNPSAIYYNPSGITQLKGFHFQVGDLNYLGINTHTQNTGSGLGSNSKFHDITVPELYMTYTPEDSQFSFGLGVYAPFGLASEYYDNTGFRSLAISAKLTYITANPILAWKPCESFSIAAGPTLNWSRIDIKRGLASAVDLFEYTGEGYSLGGNLGVMWQPCQYVSFGANYRLPSVMHYSGTSTYSPNFGGLTPASTHTSADFQYPQIISGGISFRPTPDWNIEADIDWSDWHTLRNVQLEGTGSNPFLSGALGGNDLSLALNWHGSWFYELGVTRKFDNGWWASAGYFFSTETTSEKDFTPAVPDTDLSVVSLGVGKKGEHFDWALATQLIFGPPRSITTGTANPFTGETANGSYQLFVPTISLSAGYHF